MVDADGGWLTLPLSCRAWHVGAKGNGICVGFEVCEPANIAYADSANSRLDTEKYSPNDAHNMADFQARYRNAVEMAAYMCRECGINPDHVLCHQEAAQRDMATNHADVLHWFPVFGKSMNDFRSDVTAFLRKKEVQFAQKDADATAKTSPEPENGDLSTSYKVRVTAGALNVRKGAGTNFEVVTVVHKREVYTIVEERGSWGRLKSGAGWISLNYTERI